MGFQCGIVGLPNVGKTALFNALTATIQAEAANYPFSTKESNVGRIAVPDARLDVICKLAKSAKITPTHMDFVDIAGLVSGASRGEGLGNQFLAHIRQVDAIVHVVRCFEDDNVAHSASVLDPVADVETVDTELMLADLDSLERRTDALAKKARGNDRDAAAMLALVERASKVLEAGRPARTLEVADDEASLFRQMQLLTAKPVMYVCNVDEGAAAGGNALSQKMAAQATAEGAACVVISAAIEPEIAQMEDADERADFLDSLGLEESGLNRVIHAGYDLLGLITFFTEGPKETRAWTVSRGTSAAEAGGAIHSDFARGFICAETIAYDDFIEGKGEQGAKDAGKMRQEGRNYVVKDGDLILFRFNV